MKKQSSTPVSVCPSPPLHRASARGLYFLGGLLKVCIGLVMIHHVIDIPPTGVSARFFFFITLKPRVE